MWGACRLDLRKKTHHLCSTTRHYFYVEHISFQILMITIFLRPFIIANVPF